MKTGAKPVIGINADMKAGPPPVTQLKQQYIDAIARAGGIPVLLPPGSPGDLPLLLERLDGVILSGGGDIDVSPLPLHPRAELMEKRRQAFDLALARMLLGRSVPTLGICLGMQELAFAAGGSLHQHLPDAGYAELLDHGVEGDALHEVAVDRDSRLASIIGGDRARVVSHHHQAVQSVPAPFRQTARSPDGVIEAFELPGERFFLAVQWHPERSPEDAATEKLFRAFVDAARRARV
jgi:putative glutamine amidotransferase